MLGRVFFADEERARGALASLFGLLGGGGAGSGSGAGAGADDWFRTRLSSLRLRHDHCDWCDAELDLI